MLVGWYNVGMILTKKHVLDFIKNQKLMAVATYGDHPWIASVYYTFDNDLNLFFLSSPTTLHCKMISQNNKVAVSIADSTQDIKALKRGLQIYGVATQISGSAKIKHTLDLWKRSLKVVNNELTYANMVKHVIKGRMYKITPKKIKLFDQALFKVEDGEEPILSI